MFRKQASQPASVEDERVALHQQWLELDALKRELSERVRSVEERERELQSVLEKARRDGSPLPAAGDGGNELVVAQFAALERRAAALTQRERELAEREGLAGGDSGTGVLPAAPLSDEQRLAEIEAKLAALRESEQAFARTQQELAARSEALTQRERLVAQRERELDQREDEADARPEVAELEARLRRLEQRPAIPPAPAAPSVEDTQGFSGGVRRLQEQGTRRRPES